MPSAPLAHRERRIVGALQSFDDHLHLRDVFHPLHEVPRQRGRRERHTLHVEAREHRLDASGASVSGGASRAVTAGARARIDPCHSLVCLGIAARRQIDGHRHHGTSRRLGTLQQLRGDVPVVRGVELVPQAAAASGLGDVLDRRGRLRGENLQLPSRLCGACHGQLAFGMERPLTAYGTQHDGRGELLPEELHPHVDAAHVDEPAHAQLIPVEASRIRPERLLPVDARGHVAPVCGWQHPARHGFEIVNVQSVGRARQGRGGRLRGGRLRECLEQGRIRQQQRAAGQELQELTAIRHDASG